MDNQDNNEFPELLGLKGTEALEVLQAGRPELDSHILPEGSIVTMDHRTNRVRIFVNEEGIVSQVPRVG